MYGGKSTYRKGGYIPQTQMSKEELDKKAYGSSKGPQKFTRKDVEPQTMSKRKDVKPQTQMTRKELDNLVSKKEQSKTTTKNNKVNDKESKTSSKIYNLKNDKNWEYKVEDNKWFTRKRGTTKFFDLSGDKFKSAVEKLDKEHPNARTRTMEKGGTLMSRYSKAYKEGGTPDSLMTELQKFEERYGTKLSTRPSRDSNLSSIIYFIQNMQENYKGSDKGAFKGIDLQKLEQLERAYKEEEYRLYGYTTKSDREVNKYLMSKLKGMMDGRSYQDLINIQGRYKRMATQLRKNLIKQNDSGSDVKVYNQFLQDPKSFNNFYYTGEGEKIINAQKEIEQKIERDGIDSLSKEELLLSGNLMQEEDGSFENQSKLIDSISRKYNINITPQTFNMLDSAYEDAPEVKKDRGMPNTNVETPLNEGEKTPSEKATPGPNLSTIGPTKLDTDESSELMANKEVPGPDESVDATTTDDSTVTETRDDTREKATEEYIPQSMRNRMEEKKDPTDDTNPANNVVETSVNTNNNTNVNNNANVTSNTDTSTGDEFSGPNPYEYGTDEYFDWKKRKRAAMFAKRGALVKKINYLKGGIYGKGNFRR